MVRDSAFAPDSYHMVVHVCIFNSKGEMLIQQRQPFKEGWSNMWDITVGGSATMGDSSQDAAEREVLEEIGLKLDLQDVRPHFTINFDKGFDDVYLVESDVVELNEILIPELLLDMEMSVVCDEDCKGLCFKCGKNLNLGSCDCVTREVDPRLAVLQKFLDKNK